MLATLLVKFRNKDCETTELGLLLHVLPVPIVTFAETLGSHLKPFINVFSGYFKCFAQFGGQVLVAKFHHAAPLLVFFFTSSKQLDCEQSVSTFISNSNQCFILISIQFCSLFRTDDGSCYRRNMSKRLKPVVCFLRVLLIPLQH